MRQASDDAFGVALESKARSAGQSIAVRAIFARGEAISTGKVSISGENGITQEINYGRDASLSVSAGTVWSNTAATAIADILAWQAAYRAINGGDAPGLITSSQVLAYLAVNAQFIAASTRSGSSGLTRISRDDVLAVLRAQGIGEVTVYDAQYVDTTGTKRRVISQDKFLLVPSRNDGLGDSGPLGQTSWGVPAEALNDAYGIAQDDRPGIFAGEFDSVNPEGANVLGSSIFLPVLEGYNAVLDADVY
jgi:hypothetical protein